MRHLILFASMSLTACSSTTISDAGTDAGVASDTGVGVDAAPGADSGIHTDAGLTVDSGSSSDAGRDGAPAVDSGSVVDACAFVSSLDDSCATDGSCDVVLHQTDCCGNLAALGINHADAMRFGMLEPACDAAYPVCDCLAGPVSTDSGETAADPTAIQVACVSRGPRNVCLTYVTMRPVDAP